MKHDGLMLAKLTRFEFAPVTVSAKTTQSSLKDGQVYWKKGDFIADEP